MDKGRRFTDGWYDSFKRDEFEMALDFIVKHAVSMMDLFHGLN